MERMENLVIRSVIYSLLFLYDFDKKISLGLLEIVNNWMHKLSTFKNGINAEYVIGITFLG